MTMIDPSLMGGMPPELQAILNQRQQMGQGGQGNVSTGEQRGYDAVLDDYLSTTQQMQDANNLGSLGGKLLTVGAFTNPALALVGGLMAWKAKNEQKGAKDARKEAFDQLRGHKDYDVMDLFPQEKRTPFSRLKGLAGALF